MTAEESCLLSLMRAGFTGEAPILPPSELNWSEIARLTARFSLYGLVAAGLKRLPEGELPDAAREMAKRYGAFALYDESLQSFEMGRYIERLEELRVDYCFLKGYSWRAFYPAPSLRDMGDVDLLIRIEDWDVACQAAREMGFVEKKDIDLHTVLRKDDVKLELHRCLLSSRSARAALFNDIWSRLSRVGDSRAWRMTPTDAYLFLFLHAEKHIDSYNFSPRALSDIAALRRGTKIDRAAFLREADKVNLRVFVENLEGLTDAWLDGRPFNPEQTRLIDYLLSLDSLSDAEARYRNASCWLRLNRAPSQFFEKVFLPKKTLMTHYRGASNAYAFARNLLSVFGAYRKYLAVYLSMLRRVPADRRRALAAGQRLLYAVRTRDAV